MSFLKKEIEQFTKYILEYIFINWIGHTMHYGQGHKYLIAAVHVYILIIHIHVSLCA